MATRDDVSLSISENEKTFIEQCISGKSSFRTDGRKLLEGREVQINLSRCTSTSTDSSSSSSAEIQMGKTKVNAVVTCEVVEPFLERPSEGFLNFHVELSPMASPAFDTRDTSSSLSVELARVIDRSIRGSGAIDTEALSIVSGESVWSIKCTIHVLDHHGNLLDAVSLAAIASLMHFRHPEVAINSYVSLDTSKSVPLSLHHIPVNVSYSFYHAADKRTIDPVILYDPNEREEFVTDGNLSLTFNSFKELCAVHHIGGVPVSSDVILSCVSVGKERAADLISKLEASVAAADEADTKERRERLRGKDFKSDFGSKCTVSLPEETDLGAMTDFDVLHQPIPLGEKKEIDPTVSALLERMKEAAASSSEVSAIEMNKEVILDSESKSNSNTTKEEIVDDDSEEEDVVILSSAQAPLKPSVVAPPQQLDSTTKTTLSDSSEDDDLASALLS